MNEPPTGATGPAGGRRLRVLISAYACAPGLDEPEAGAGWAFARAAAVHHDVWVVTRHRFEPAVSAALAAEPEIARHLTVVYLDLSPRTMALRRRPGSVYWYYALWQRALRRTAADLHARQGFDVVHHVTFAVDWQYCGLGQLARTVPFVWGPVGGASYQPWRLAGCLGPRGIVGEVVRSSATRIARRIWGDPMARAARLVLAQNTDDARRFASSRRVVLEPNSAFAALPLRTTRAGDGRKAVFVGRLVAWKGPALAVAAMAEAAADDWTLDLYGTGPQLPRLQKLVRDLGLAGRVTFHGHVPRSRILEVYGEVDAMLFPSMHDSAPWAVGEASSMGLPVICLDVGGPPVLADVNGYPVRVAKKSRKAVIAALASELVSVGGIGGRQHERWSAGRLETLIDEWYQAAVAEVPATS